MGEALLAGAASSGNVDIVKWATKKQKLIHTPNEIPYLQQPCRKSSHNFAAASESGNVEIFELLDDGNCEFFYALTKAARHGNDEAFFWLYARNNDISDSRPPYFCETAAMNGHFKLAKKIYKENDSVIQNDLVEAGAKYGNINFLKWMKRQDLDVDKNICGKTALKYGQLEILKWLQTKKWECGKEACNDAAESGRIEVVQWAKDNGSEWSEETMKIAARNGHLDLVKWLRTKNCPWSAETTQQAAYYEKLQVLKWLIENSCPYILHTQPTEDDKYRIDAERLANYDAIDVLGYLLQYGIPLDSECYKFRNWNVNLWLNEFLFKNGCELKPNLWREAINNASIKQLEWLKEKNCPWDTKTAFDKIYKMEMSTLKWLQNNGFDKSEKACEFVAKHGTLKVLKWMRENGWPWSESVSKAAAVKNDFGMFKWAVENGCPVNFNKCKKETSKAILKYIKQCEYTLVT